MSMPSEPGLIEWVNVHAPQDVKEYFAHLAKEHEKGSGKTRQAFREAFDGYWFEGRLSSAPVVLSTLVALAPRYGSHNAHIEWDLVASQILNHAGR